MYQEPAHGSAVRCVCSTWNWCGPLVVLSCRLADLRRPRQLHACVWGLDRNGQKMGITRSPLSLWSFRASHGISQKTSWTSYRRLWALKASVPGDLGGKSQLLRVSSLRSSRSSLLLYSTWKATHQVQGARCGEENPSI